MRLSSLVLLLSVGCHKDGAGGKDASSVIPGDDDDAVDTQLPASRLAADLGIGKVSVFQGVEAILWAGGDVPKGKQAPVIATREAMLRVFVQPEGAFEARDIIATLTVRTEGADDVVLDLTQKVDAASRDASLKSTFNFDLTGDQIALSSEFRVELHEADDAAPGEGDAAATTWDSEEQLPDGLPTGKTDDVTVVILPVVYQADGSNRKPNTSQGQLDAIRDRMYALYPARSITITVGDDLPWNRDISAFGTGWSQLLDAASNIRGDADEPANTYYYAMFEPENDFYQFCAAGCVAGLSQLGFNTSNPSLRTSIGLGYPEVAADTLVHELGHAHGRFHADCGGAQGTDPNYPHPNAEIGSWGYDLLAKELWDPVETTDMMGYCFPFWVSNYTFYGLWDRIAELSDQAPGTRLAYTRVTRLRTDGAGHTEVTGSVRVGDPAGGGLKVEVDLFDAGGADAGRVQGWMFPNDHLPGGVVTLDHELAAGWTARVIDP